MEGLHCVGRVQVSSSRRHSPESEVARGGRVAREQDESCAFELLTSETGPPVLADSST